ncbi:MAG: DUF3024 domain-containing protein [Desulfuromonadales bacterium]|nr:DUF3024 domain-containing protein [Desulfuromonadales bacterium]
MTLPDLVQRTAEKILLDYCQKRTQSCAFIGVQFATEGDCITLLGQTGCHHPAGAGELRPVARFCYNSSLGQWTLHYPGPDSSWPFYLNVTPSLDLNKLLHCVDQDPLGVFWS